MDGKYLFASLGVSLVLTCVAPHARAGGGTATIAGHASNLGAPLSFMWVDLESADGVTYSDSAATGADGNYVFTDVPAGTYRVCLNSNIYDLVPQCFDHVDRASPSPGTPAYTPLVVAEGMHATGIDFDLVEGNGLEGRITDARNGRPIADLRASFGYFDQQGQWYGEGHLHTDTDGRYRVVGLPDGDYYLWLSADGPFWDAGQSYGGHCDTECNPTQGTLITLANGSIHPGIDFELHPIAIIRGHVRDAATQQGASSAVVSSFYGQTSPFGTIWTRAWSTHADIDGAYELYSFEGAKLAAEGDGALVDIVYPDIPCSSYVVVNCVHDGQTVVVPVPKALEGIDFSLPTGIGVTGTVVSTSGKAPVPSALVTIVDADETLQFSTTTGADGTYTFPSWLPRSSDVYYARVAEGIWPYTCSVYLDRPCPADGQPFSSVAPTPIHLVAGMNQLRMSVADDGIFHASFDP